MAITYTWEITNLRKAPKLNDYDNVIVHVRWKKIGTDENGTTGEFQGATPFDAPPPGNPNFTPFEELTKEQVLGWVQSIVVGTYEEHVNRQIEKQIIKKNDPWEDVAQTPWGDNIGSGVTTPPVAPAPTTNSNT